MISKIRHGIDITSSKLNEIIEAINNLEGTSNSLSDLADDYRTSLSEFNAMRDNYNTQLSDMLTNLPTLRELVASFAAINEYGIEWEDRTSNGETEELAKIAAMIDGSNLSVNTDKRIKFVVARYTQIMPLGGVGVTEWRTPQVLFDVDNGAIYADVKRVDPDTLFEKKDRVLFSIGNANVDNITNIISSIIENTPSISIVTSNILDAEGNIIYYWKVGDTVYDGGAGIGHGPLVPVYKQGPAGKDGAIGPQGKDGKQGIPGITGQPGKDGLPGADAVVDIYYSDYAAGLDYSNIYNGQKYIGFRSYASNATASEIAATPIKWARLSGDSYVPYLDEENKKIKWKVIESLSDIDNLSIDLQKITVKGDPGPEGPCPNLRFIDNTSGLYSTIVGTKGTDERGETFYAFYKSDFVGPAGPQGLPGADGGQGPKGETGPAPTFRNILVDLTKNITTASAKVTSTTTEGVYDMSFQLPMRRSMKTIQQTNKGTNSDSYKIIYEYEDGTTEEGSEFIVKHGTSITAAYIEQSDNSQYKGWLTFLLSDASTIRLLDTASLKGDKGEPALMNIKGSLYVNDMRAYNNNDTRQGKNGDAYLVFYYTNNDGDRITSVEGYDTLEQAFAAGVIKKTYTLWFWDDNALNDFNAQGCYVDTGANLAGEKGEKGDRGERGVLWFFGNIFPQQNSDGVLYFDFGTDAIQAIFNDIITRTDAGATINLIPGDLYVYTGTSNYKVYKAINFNSNTNFGYFKEADIELGYSIDEVKTISATEANASITEADGKRTLNLQLPKGEDAKNIIRTESQANTITDTLDVTLVLDDGTKLNAFKVPNGKAPKVNSYKFTGETETSYAWTDASGNWYYENDGTTPVRAKGKKGDPGADGEDGVGISNIECTYAKSSSATTTPSSFTTSLPSFSDEEKQTEIYLWTKIVISLTKGNPKTYYSVARQGKDGTKGETGDRGAGIYYYGANGSDIVNKATTGISENAALKTGDKIIDVNGKIFLITTSGNMVSNAQELVNLHGADGTCSYVFTGEKVTATIGNSQTVNIGTNVPLGQTTTVEAIPGSFYYNTRLNRLFICTAKSRSETTWKCILAPFSDYVSYENGTLTITAP